MHCLACRLIECSTNVFNLIAPGITFLMFRRFEIRSTCLFKSVMAANSDMGQSIQEWGKWNLWKAAFKNCKVIYDLLNQTLLLQIF